jgi:hypothetical protein
MPGIPNEYTWATADVVDFYAEHPGCLMAIWLPASWASQARTSVIVEFPGGGWTSGTQWLDFVHDRDKVLTGGAFPNLCLEAGFAFVFAAWPFGWIAENVRYYPNQRHPSLQRLAARAVQRLKTRAAARRSTENVTGDPAHTLATDASQYVLKGNSSGADNAGWAIYQHDGLLPYWPDDGSAHQWDRWMVRASHRCRAVILEDAMTDFRLFDPGAGVSPSLVPLFGNPNRFLSTPKIADVPPEVLRDASILPLVEADAPTNRDIAVLAVGVGAAGNGWIMNDPALTAQQFRGLAAPRQPIPGLSDVHEQGTLLLLEDALKLNEAAAGRSWSETEHRIVWGNATNNPDGLHLIDSNLGATVPEYYFRWITEVLGIPPFAGAPSA